MNDKDLIKRKEEAVNKLAPGEWCYVDPEDHSMYLKSIPGVIDCLCGDHPWPNAPRFGRILEEHVRDYLHCGLPRSGSTVVWQIMNELFPNKIVRSHGFADSCPLLYEYKKIICCVRHPFDVYESMKRTGISSYNVEEKFDEAMIDLLSFTTLDFMNQNLKFLTPQLNLQFVRYEDFYEKDEERVKWISLAVDKFLSQKDIKYIANKFSIDRNTERADKLNGFSEIDVQSQIHGDHIGNNRGKPYSSTISEEKKQIIEEKYSWFFEYFQYTYY